MLEQRETEERHAVVDLFLRSVQIRCDYNRCHHDHHHLADEVVEQDFVLSTRMLDRKWEVKADDLRRTDSTFFVFVLNEGSDFNFSS